MAEQNSRKKNSINEKHTTIRNNIDILSRRGFIKTVGASIGGLALGVDATETAAATVVEEKCGNFATIDVGNGEFSLINNQWSTTTPSQCIQRDDDGSYGWEWDRGSTDTTNPNYPQVLIGTKPWGDNTGSSLFPIQRGDVNQLEFTLDIDQNISGSDWNLAEEWWLTSKQPGGDVSDSITHEVMLVLNWGADHTHGTPIENGAVRDSYGNTIDYWANYPSGVDFHIFRIAANDPPAAVDLTAIMEYLTTNVASVSSDLWLSGVELGNENWDNTSGSTSINQFDVTVNGETAVSGTDGTQSLVLTDYSSYPGENNLGNWSGGGSFVNGDGEVVDGALTLTYDNAGWYTERVDRDVSAYTDLVFRIKGANGGEQRDFTLADMGLFADIADGEITTSYSDIRVDLTEVGVDRTSMEKVKLSFWQGQSGTVTIDEIRFE